MTRLIAWTFSARAEISVQLTELRFQYDLLIRYLESGARYYVKKISGRFELPGLKKFHVIARNDFSPGWRLTSVEIANWQNYRGYRQTPVPGSVPILVSVRVEIFHVIRTFFNLVCRAEIFPCNQPGPLTNDAVNFPTKVNELIYHWGSDRFKYVNYSIWLLHKRSDISRIVRSGGVKKPYIEKKFQFFDKIWNYATNKEKKLTMKNEVGEELLNKMTTELQDFIMRSLHSHLWITFQ